MKIGWIVFVVIILANVIGPILQKRSEKARKQRQQGAPQPGRPAQPSVAPDPPSVSTGSSRMEQLIARRQAQLEELRERREQRSSTPQARIGPASQPTTTVRPAPFLAPAPQPTRRVTRQATARPSASMPSAARQSRPQPGQRLRVSTEAVAQPATRKRLVTLGADRAASVPPKSAPSPFLSLDPRNITPQLLRRLVVLKEIFDAPIALRNRDIWDRPG